MPFFVYIVCIGIERKTEVVHEIEQESASEPPVISAACSFNVSDIALPVFILQIHVHHVVPVLSFTAEKAVHVALALIDLDMLYSKIGEIFQQDFFVSAHE